MHPRKAWWYGISLVAGLLAVLGFALLRPGTGDTVPAFYGTAYEPPEPVPTVTLTDHTGRAVSLSDYRGQPALVFFGFTHCPDVCPLTLSKLRRLTGSMGLEPDALQVLLVTVDPERDTPAVLTEYVRQFGPQVTGLTGDPQELARLRSGLGVYGGSGSAAGMSHGMGHTDAIFGIDRAGQLRVLMHPDAPDEEISNDIRTLLRL